MSGAALEALKEAAKHSAVIWQWLVAMGFI